MTLTWRLMFLLCFSLAASGQAAPPVAPFETVAPGIEYRQVSLDRPRALLISQLRCDPKRVRFSLLLASDAKGKKVSRADEMVKKFRLTAAINCSYFDDDERVLGYHERLGQVLNPDTADGGVFGGLFFWNGSRAGLKARGESLPAGAPVIFQAGPRLVWDGQPIAGLEKHDLAARSGVSIDAQGRVTLFALGLTSMTTLAELPALLSAPVERGGMGSWRALNFDGGSSTQFSLVAGKRRVSLPGLAPVPAFLGVSSR